MDGAQQESLYNALLDAYDPTSLTMMLSFRLNRRLVNYVSSNVGFGSQVFELMEKAKMEGWLRELVVKAGQYRPGNAALLKSLQEFDLAPVPRTKESEQSAPFERMIEETNPFIDPVSWIEKAGQALRRVCHISVSYIDGRKAYGTGFLVGPDAVLTNYHVIEPVLKHLAEANAIRIRFDYCAAPDGFAVYPGIEYSLGDTWLIDHSLYDAADLTAAPAANPDPDHLDYALLRLAQPAGNVPAGRLGKQPGEDAPPRGWIVLPTSSFAWQPDIPLMILQHPGGKPMKLAYRSDARIEVNGNATRVRYGLNTDNGSSGSPCFNKDWEPVALHHAGDPDYARIASYNQGIPLSVITARIQSSDAGKQAISVLQL